MAIASVVIYRHGLGTTFYFDEWAFVIDRQPWRWDILLTPYNGHLSLLPLLVYKILFATVGLEPYWIYRLVLLGFHLACVGLLFVYARRRVGDALAVCAAALLLFLGTAWHDLLVPFQIGFLGSVAGGLAMFVALDRPGLAADATAAAALAVSLSSSSLGISFAAAAFVEVLLLPNRWRRIWLAALPTAAYLVWYYDYRDSPEGLRAAVGPIGTVLRANFPLLASYMADAAATAIGGLAGLSTDWGRLLLVAGVILLVVRLGGSRPLQPRLLALLAAALTYWGLLAAFRGQLVPSNASRYIYGGAVLIVLVALELAVGTRVRPHFLGWLALAVVFSAVGNYAALRDGSRALQDGSAQIRAEFGALEVAGTSVDPNYMPDPAGTQNVRAGRYLAVVRAHGSPADSPEEIARAPEPIREEADGVLAHALGVYVVSESPASGGPALRSVAAAGGKTLVRGSCLDFRPRASPALLELVLPDRGVVIAPKNDSPVAFSLRHFAAAYSASLGSVSRPSLIRVGHGSRPLTWYLQLETSAPLRACSARTA
jgi:hypothetical protein